MTAWGSESHKLRTVYRFPDQEPFLLFIEQLIPRSPHPPVNGYAALNMEDGGEGTFSSSCPNLRVELGVHS